MMRIEFDFSVAADHPSLAGHFPGNPVVPGVLLLDHAIDALHRACGLRVVRLQRVKFLAALRPGEKAHGHWEVDEARATFRCGILRNGDSTKLAEGVCILDAGSAA